MWGDDVRGVAASMREGSEQAARAGTALAGLADELPTPATGLRLDSAIGALSASWTEVLDDLVTGLVQLATWMDDAVTVTVDADTVAEQSLRGIPR